MRNDQNMQPNNYKYNRLVVKLAENVKRPHKMSKIENSVTKKRKNYNYDVLRFLET